MGLKSVNLYYKEEFFTKMNDKQEVAWLSFLGNKQAGNYQALADSKLLTFKNLGALSDEQGERSNQDLKPLKERYHGRRDSIMTEYCWSIKRDCPEEIKRKSYKRKFLPE